MRLLADCGVVLPPILVHRPTMGIIDGVHRVQAAILRGQKEIDAEFVDGSSEDAFVLAVRVNVDHGLPLSLADRKAAAERILDTHPDWSDRAIAAAVGLSHKTVGAIRRRASGEKSHSHARVGRDGIARRLDATAGRRRAGDLLAERPDATLREISAEAGVSTSTVRDVRDRLRQGRTPVIEQRSRTGGRESAAPAKADHLEILRRLRADPSLRFTEHGRALLRSLDVWMADPNKWPAAASVPDHWASVLADLIDESAQAWKDLASQLRRRISN